MDENRQGLYTATAAIKTNLGTNHRFIQMTRRFLVFQWLSYDTAGGWADKTGDFDTYEEAKASIQLEQGWSGQIVDLNFGKVVYEHSRSFRENLYTHARKIIEGQHPNPLPFDSAKTRTT